MGKKLPFLEERHKIKENLVQGCQSRVYLTATLSADQCVFFRVHSDALISSGLAALLLFIYQGETAPFILHCPPLFIRDLGLMQSLSPGRSNGLISMYTKMKKVTINLILNNQH